MKHCGRLFSFILLTGIVSCLWSSTFSVASANTGKSLGTGTNPNPIVLPVGSNPYGASYGEWAARFWQWAFSLPVDHHPLYDTADCSAGQSGPVWFLGGSFTPSVVGGQVVAIVTRDCTIPSGIALFIPVINSEASTLEGNGTTEAELRAAAQSFQDLAANMSCEVDGVSVQNLDSYRVQSPLYTYGPLPENNILQSFGLDAPAGSTSPSVADGVHVMLAPLAVGQHTIHFHGEVPAFNFLLDITYNMTVKGTSHRGQVITGTPAENMSWSAMKGLYRR